MSIYNNIEFSGYVGQVQGRLDEYLSYVKMFFSGPIHYFDASLLQWQLTVGFYDHQWIWMFGWGLIDDNNSFYSIIIY